MNPSKFDEIIVTGGGRHRAVLLLKLTACLMCGKGTRAPYHRLSGAHGKQA